MTCLHLLGLHGSLVVLWHAAGMLWVIVLLICKRIDAGLAIVLLLLERHLVRHGRGQGGLRVEALLTLRILARPVVVVLGQGVRHGVHVVRSTTARSLRLRHVELG